MSYQQQKNQYQKKQHPPITTTKGTVLPMLDMRGKAYLEVKYRLVWFREDHPDWRIKTSPISITNDSALFCSEIFDNQGNLISTSHKFENSQGFADFIEKAETGSIGRALALIGYGTQFAPDLEEGERIVDSPANPPKKSKAKNPAKEALEDMEAAEASPGEYEIKSGSQKGRKLKSYSAAELLNMANSIKEHFFNINKEVPPASQELLDAIKACLNEQEMNS